MHTLIGKIKKLVATRLVVTTLILFSISSPLYAQQSLIYFILDGSGSMWGRIDGKMKIQVAKEVMTELIRGMPDNFPTALMSYGLRKKADCSDIQELIPIGALDKTNAIKTIKNITPKGKTPISDSLIRVATKVKAGTYKTSIVLISDGIETCHKDPCAVTRKLIESGIQFTPYVIGFNIKGDAGKQQLECIAKTGGGQYFSAENADELLKTLTKIKKSVVENKPIKTIPINAAKTLVPVIKKQAVTNSSSSIHIQVNGPGKIRLVHDDWLKAPYYWRLLDPETGNEKARFSGGSLDPQSVQAGEYQVNWRHLEYGSQAITLSEVITVESRKTADLMLKTGIKLQVPSWVNPPFYWGLKDLQTHQIVGKFSVLEPVLVPTGSFEFVWRQVEHGAKETSLGAISIQPDKLNNIVLMTAFHPVPASWVPKKIMYWGLKKPGSKTMIARFGNNFDPQLVAPGNYTLVYRSEEHGSYESILGQVHIKKGQLNEFSMNTGVKLNPQKGMDKPYRIEYIELDKNNKPLRKIRQWENFKPMALTPGRYKITYWQKEHGSSPFTLVESFDLPKGALVEIDL